LKEYGSYFDTISVCLSKGLGAPVGSLMISTRERVSRARVWRKRYGAGMRQIGLLAAAGHYALDHNILLLTQDHIRAKKLASACHQIAPSSIDPTTVETNIVGLDLTGSKIDAAQFASLARENGLWLSALGPMYVRLVTHMDINDEDIDRACEILQKLLQSAFVAK
jgi:threonine aldolase